MVRLSQRTSYSARSRQCGHENVARFTSCFSLKKSRSFISWSVDILVGGSRAPARSYVLATILVHSSISNSAVPFAAAAVLAFSSCSKRSTAETRRVASMGFGS